MTRKYIFLLIVFLSFLNGCQIMDVRAPSPETDAFELFLVDESQMTGADIQNYELNKLPLEEEPLIISRDILRYNWGTHTIDLKAEAHQKVLSQVSRSMPLNGTPFVIISRGERLYAGAFWSMASSLSFDGVVILPFGETAGNSFSIDLGYPTRNFFTGKDPRGNLRLKQALKDAGLLEE